MALSIIMGKKTPMSAFSECLNLAIRVMKMLQDSANACSTTTAIVPVRPGRLSCSTRMTAQRDAWQLWCRHHPLLAQEGSH